MAELNTGIDLVTSRTPLPQPKLVLDVASPGDARQGYSAQHTNSNVIVHDGVPLNKTLQMLT